MIAAYHLRLMVRCFGEVHLDSVAWAKAATRRPLNTLVGGKQRCEAIALFMSSGKRWKVMFILRHSCNQVMMPLVTSSNSGYDVPMV